MDEVSKKFQISFGHDWIDFWWWLWKKALKCILGKCITQSKTNVFFFLGTGEILSCRITLSKKANLPNLVPAIGKGKANQTLIPLIGKFIMISIKSQIHFLLSNHYWWTLDNKWFRQISISPTSYNHYLPAYCLLREVGSPPANKNYLTKCTNCVASTELGCLTKYLSQIGICLTKEPPR